ncbi:hypothetical protein DERP_006598 [Dermatophagoides pteronyssinus]|nr:hypothetical protein DERP_006598 [Dermatophagoides pteronyssinus]
MKILIISIFIWIINLEMNEMIPFQRCALNSECSTFCSGYGYNRSECNVKKNSVFRMNRFCECYECDFVLCATYCTKNNLKFVGCSCFALPALVGHYSTFNTPNNVDMNQLLTNECYDNKFLCQCSK